MKPISILPILLSVGLIFHASTNKLSAQLIDRATASIQIAADTKGAKPVSPVIKKLELAIAEQEKRVQACRDELSRIIRKAPPMTKEQEENLSDEERRQRGMIAEEYQKAKIMFEAEQDKLNKLRIDLIREKAKQSPPKKKKI